MLETNAESQPVAGPGIEDIAPLDFRDVDEATFQRFCNWLYDGFLQVPVNTDQLKAYKELYLLGDKHKLSKGRRSKASRAGLIGREILPPPR